MRICVNAECPDVVAGYAEYADATEVCARCGNALEKAPADPQEEGQAFSGSLVTVFRGPELGQVRLLESLLREAGLTVYVYGQHEALTGGGATMLDQWRTASLQVPEEQAEEARTLLADAEAKKVFSDEAPEGAAGGDTQPAQRIAAVVPVARVGLPFSLVLFVGLPVLLGLQHFLGFDQWVLLGILFAFAMVAFWAGSRFPAEVSVHACGNCGHSVGPTQSFCEACDRKLEAPAAG